jgi:hypothetical protein
LAKCVGSQAETPRGDNLSFDSSKKSPLPSTDGFSFVVVIIRLDMPAISFSYLLILLLSYWGLDGKKVALYIFADPTVSSSLLFSFVCVFFLLFPSFSFSFYSALPV